MDSSLGKSIGSRPAICSGLQAVAHRRSLRRPWRLPPQATSGPATVCPSGASIRPSSLSWTYVRNCSLTASFAGFGRRACRSAFHWAVEAR